MSTSRTVVEEFVVPASFGRGFVVPRGHTLRIEQVEGKQVVDATFQNADNLRETFHAGQSMALNEFRNARGIGRAVEVDGHRTCQQNLEEALAPFGVEPDLVPDVFNIWMNTTTKQRSGSSTWSSSRRSPTSATTSSCVPR